MKRPRPSALTLLDSFLASKQKRRARARPIRLYPPSNDAIPADEMALAEVIAAWLWVAEEDELADWHAESGTPSNDDVPRDEMLLATMLASMDYEAHPFAFLDGSALLYGCDRRIALRGFDDMPPDEGNSDAYAAGAALALALESES